MVIPNQKRILLVEDYEDARDLAALTLTEYTLISAHDFREGLRLARRGYFDLYILDNWLPDRSGVELCLANLFASVLLYIELDRVFNKGLD
jgi:DNA-binding response OmpR family regulator